METWKPLYKCWFWIDYEWTYEVSNFGRIRSLPKKWHNWKILKNQKWNWEWRYLSISLSLKGKVKQYLVHRLVKYVFHGYMNLEVDHIDSDTTNNHIDNLQYLSAKDNMRKAFKEWRITSEMCWSAMRWKFWKYHNRSKTVYQYTLDWEFIKEYWSTKEVERKLWYNAQNIATACRLSKIRYWFIWKYKNND